MDRDTLVLVLAAVFAGLTTLLVVTAFVSQPFLLLAALPFAATTYLLWYHASGRLEARTRRRARRARRTDGRGAGTRARHAPGGGRRSGRRTRSRASPGGNGAGRETRGRPGVDRLSRSEALQRLGLEPDADQEAIRRAYRRRAKEVHPDTATGDEESFKRLTRAYERLSEE